LAARALLSETADETQTSMLAIEAQYTGVETTDLAATIVGRANYFKRLIGLAGGVRSKARAALYAATDVAGIEAALDAARQDVDEALASLNSG